MGLARLPLSVCDVTAVSATPRPGRKPAESVKRGGDERHGVAVIMIDQSTSLLLCVCQKGVSVIRL